MDLQSKINAVSRMERYIVNNLDAEITADDLSCAAGYSKFYSLRIFKELTGKSPFETIRALRLTKSAQKLQSSDSNVLDVALESGFNSHDGFTRAFKRQFDITPLKYRREKPAIRWILPGSIDAYYILKEGKRLMQKEPIKRTMTVTAIERPVRKMILLRSINAKGYFDYCEEVGCDWFGLLCSIPEKLECGPALLTLPPNLIKEGTGNTAGGVEVPFDYNKPAPDGCDIIELSPCTMLFFQGATFENENDFGVAIDTLWEVMDTYTPETYGWKYAPELAPYFNFGASPDFGAKMAQSVVTI